MNEAKLDRRCRRYIRINDTTQWNLIDEIMTLPQYEKSFNKVINDALFYGLQELRDTLFENVKENTATKEDTQTLICVGGSNDELLQEEIRLLKEIVLSTVMSKSMISSLFRVMESEVQGVPVDADKFSNGALQATPDYLAKYELRALRDIRK